MDENALGLEIFSDTTLKVSNSLVGSMDLSLYIWEKKQVNLGSYFVPTPAIIVIGEDGLVLAKKYFESPGTPFNFKSLEMYFCLLFIVRNV